jgi:ribose 5-phosphate isomerase B
MKIYLSSDHAGFELKNHLADFLKDKGFTVIDKGPFSYVEGDDYPDYTKSVAEEILRDPDDSRGIILGGSGEGEAISVNRMKGIMCGVYYGGNLDIIKLSREHNNSNILSLGARFITNTEAEEAVTLWLETGFSGDERHKRRLSKIDS